MVSRSSVSPRSSLSILNDERRAANLSKLRWAFVEASAQWVPWVVKEAIRRTGTKGFPKLPFKEFNIYVTTETNDDFDYVLR